MRVLFLIQGWEVAASRYRVLQYLPYLRDNGIVAEVTAYPTTVWEARAFFKALPQHDIVFLQRRRLTGWKLWLLRRQAKRIVYDFDDAVMYRDSTARNPLSTTRMKRFSGIVAASDVVIAGNEYLRRQALKQNARVEVIPSPIDIERYPLKSYETNEKEVVLGWIGDHGSIHYLEGMRPVLEALAAKYPHLRLKIVCDTFLECNGLKVIKKPWSRTDEIQDLQSFDIGLMPLTDDPWSWGKCGLKVIQYQGVGVPVVCTPVGVNQDLVEHQVTGLWARSEQEWIENLSIFIEDPALREKMGRKGRERVKRGYTTQQCRVKLRQVLESLVSE
jgi:glycosyltransferase involved in cell wall biosynthesis